MGGKGKREFWGRGWGGKWLGGLGLEGILGNLGVV
jgi:hypothetical protein